MSVHTGEPEYHIDHVQLKYAAILRWVAGLGIALMLASFFIYAAGWLESPVSVADLPELWHLSSHELREIAGHGAGWSWVVSIGTGRNLAFAALVFFPAATIVVVAVGSALYRMHGSRAYALIALAEAFVLVLAASGLLST